MLQTIVGQDFQPRPEINMLPKDKEKQLFIWVSTRPLFPKCLVMFSHTKNYVLESGFGKSGSVHKIFYNSKYRLSLLCDSVLVKLHN